MAERKVYTAEFKLEAVRLSRHPDKTIAEVADSLGVGRSTLTAWRRHHRKQGEIAFPGHGRPALTPQEAEIQRLKRELEITRQELGPFGLGEADSRSVTFSKRLRPSYRLEQSSKALSLHLAKESR